MAERLLAIPFLIPCYLISKAVELLPDFLDTPVVQNQINA